MTLFGSIIEIVQVIKAMNKTKMSPELPTLKCHYQFSKVQNKGFYKWK